MDDRTRQLQAYNDRLGHSIRRAGALTKTARKMTDRSAAQDMLRAAVILNHAYLEDLMRTVAALLLPEAGENALNDIPLVGSGMRAEKFYLGKLSLHRGKSVKELIRESVSEHLARSNFNNIEEIARMLKTLGFKLSDHEREFPMLQEMILRRHQIVHRGDVVRTGKSRGLKLQPIDEVQVANWHMAMLKFAKGVLDKFHGASLELTVWPRIDALREELGLSRTKKPRKHPK
jgi:hypothetical protein